MSVLIKIVYLCFLGASLSSLVLATSAPLSSKESKDLKINYSDFEFYKDLQKALEAIKSVPQETGASLELEMNHPPLKLSMKGEQVLLLKKILIQKGFLTAQPIEALTDIFDKDLLTAVKEFQHKYLLDDDGVVGASTKRFLNLTPEKEKELIELNLKRWEKVPPISSKKFILVNIAAYQVYAFDLDETDSVLKPVLTIDAVVGRNDRRTPLFHAPLFGVTLNPVWNVPQSIAKKDKIQKIKNDPSYLKRAHLSVLNHDGSELDPDEVDWDNFSYRLVQSSGAHNALGRIKFSLDDPDSIYMHDTPEKDLFSKPRRALSSGCIRLKEPLELAKWVLKDTTYATEASLQSTIQSGRTKHIKLDQSIPVYVVYFTTWVDHQEKLLLSDDPYSLDSKKTYYS